MALPLCPARSAESNRTSSPSGGIAACTVKLALWENQIKTGDATDTTIWFKTPIPGEVDSHRRTCAS
jgi:hypothetical protein